MNRELRVYTEIQSLYDVRRGLLQWLMTEGITDDAMRIREGDRLWGLHMAKNYKERRMDTFEFPHLKINKARYDALAAAPSLEHWLMFYPTLATKTMLRKIMELEQLTDVPITIKGVTLFVNTFPYAFDQEMQDSFLEQCNKLFGFRFAVKLTYNDPSLMPAESYLPYDYVFKYNLMAEGNTLFQETVGKTPMPNVTFVIPDILVKDVESFTGSISDRIFAWSMALAPVVKFIPIGHVFYDAIEG